MQLGMKGKCYDNKKIVLKYVNEIGKCMLVIWSITFKFGHMWLAKSFNLIAPRTSFAKIRFVTMETHTFLTVETKASR